MRLLLRMYEPSTFDHDCTLTPKPPPRPAAATLKRKLRAWLRRTQGELTAIVQMLEKSNEELQAKAEAQGGNASWGGGAPGDGGEGNPDDDSPPLEPDTPSHAE